MISAMGGWSEIFSLAWVVPLLLDALSAVAFAIYEMLVSGGIVYILIWGWLAFTIGLSLAKMYFPKDWLSLFAFSGGGEMYDPKTDGWSILKNVGKPIARAVFASVFLLQVRPEYITNIIINPFLEFGGVYVGTITKSVLPKELPKMNCPKGLDAYFTQDSCDFLIRPIRQVSAVNGGMISKGFDFLMGGIASLLLPVDLPQAVTGMAGWGSIITGLLLIATFFSSNFFMSLLLIQGIFKFGLNLAFYPFKVLIYVIKKPDGDEWVDPFPAFADILESLKKLVVAMVAVAFILLINISVVGAMFNFDPTTGEKIAGHATSWIICLMTLWLVVRVFAITREQLDKYVADPDMTGFYDKVKKDAAKFANNAWNLGKKGLGLLKQLPK